MEDLGTGGVVGDSTPVPDGVFLYVPSYCRQGWIGGGRPGSPRQGLPQLAFAGQARAISVSPVCGCPMVVMGAPTLCTSILWGAARLGGLGRSQELEKGLHSETYLLVYFKE